MRGDRGFERRRVRLGVCERARSWKIWNEGDLCVGDVGGCGGT